MATTLRARLEEWREFLRRTQHLLRGRPELLFQEAANQPDATAPAAAAIRRESGHARPWFRWLNKPMSPGRRRCTIPATGSGCCFSPDGGRIVAGAAVWNLAAGNEEFELGSATRNPWACAWSRDGRLIAADQDNVLRVWDAATGELKRSFSGHQLTIWKIDFADPEHIISLAVNPHHLPDRPGGELRVWDLASGEELIAMGHQFHSDWDFTVRPDGSRLAVVADRSLYTIDLRERVLLLDHSLAPAEIYFTCCAYRADGRLYAGVWNQEPSEREGKSDDENYGALWEVDDESGTVVKEMLREPKAIRSCEFSIDGSRLLLHGNEIWNPDGRPARVERFPGHSRGRLAPDGGAIALPGRPHGVEVVYLGVAGPEASRPRVRLTWQNHDGARVRFPSDARGVIVERGPITAARFVSSFAVHTALSPDGRTIARFWPEDADEFPQDPEHTALDVELGGETAPAIRLPYLSTNCEPDSLAFSPDGRCLAVVTWEGRLLVWELDRSRMARSLTVDFPVSCFVWGRDGSTIVAAGYPDRLAIIDLATGQVVRHHAGAPESTRALAISPDGRVVAAASATRIVLVDLETATVRVSRNSRTSKIGFSPEGRYVLGITDGLFRVLDVATLDECAVFATTTSRFNAIVSVGGRVFLLDDLDGFPVIEAEQLPLTTPVVTAMHLFRLEDPGFEPDVTFRCAWCQERAAVPPPVLEKLVPVTARQAADPAGDLARQAGNAVGLADRCPGCAQPVRFNPFVVGKPAT